MDDQGKTVTTTQNQEPWGPQQPYLKTGFERAQGMLDQGPQEYYPGQTVADFSAQSGKGQTDAMFRAQQGQDLGAFTTGGGFLDAGNPHFQKMVGQIGQAMRPSIDSAFASSGRLGSGAHANAFASALGDQAGKLAFQNYGMERDRQIAASQDYSAPNAMMGIGNQVEAKNQQYLNDMQKRWDFGQNAEQTALANFMNTIGGKNFGASNTTQTPYTGNSGMQMVGTGLAGLGALGQGLPGLLSALGIKP